MRIGEYMISQCGEFSIEYGFDYEPIAREVGLYFERKYLKDIYIRLNPTPGVSLYEAVMALYHKVKTMTIDLDNVVSVSFVHGKWKIHHPSIIIDKGICRRGKDAPIKNLENLLAFMLNRVIATCCQTAAIYCMDNMREVEKAFANRYSVDPYPIPIYGTVYLNDIVESQPISDGEFCPFDIIYKYVAGRNTAAVQEAELENRSNDMYTTTYTMRVIMSTIDPIARCAVKVVDVKGALSDDVDEKLAKYIIEFGLKMLTSVLSMFPAQFQI